MEDKSKEAYEILRSLLNKGMLNLKMLWVMDMNTDFGGRLNLKQAEYWYRKAANQNYIKAIHNLGLSIFLQKRYKEAFPYFEKAASMNHADSVNMLGAYYLEGILFDQNYEKALDYFRKAIEIDENNASAQFNIGQAYYNGAGVEQDYKHAFEWYVKSANQDYSLAQIQLAEMYLVGKA